jgi:hypothetical protein
MDVQIQTVMADIADSLGLKKPEGRRPFARRRAQI